MSCSLGNIIHAYGLYEIRFHVFRSPFHAAAFWQLMSSLIYNKTSQGVAGAHVAQEIRFSVISYSRSALSTRPAYLTVSKYGLQYSFFETRTAQVRKQIGQIGGGTDTTRLECTYVEGMPQGLARPSHGACPQESSCMSTAARVCCGQSLTHTCAG